MNVKRLDTVLPVSKFAILGATDNYSNTKKKKEKKSFRNGCKLTFLISVTYPASKFSRYQKIIEVHCRPLDLSSECSNQ